MVQRNTASKSPSLRVSLAHPTNPSLPPFETDAVLDLLSEISFVSYDALEALGVITAEPFDTTNRIPFHGMTIRETPKEVLLSVATARGPTPPMRVQLAAVHGWRMTPCYLDTKAPALLIGRGLIEQLGLRLEFDSRRQHFEAERLSSVLWRAPYVQQKMSPVFVPAVTVWLWAPGSTMHCKAQAFLDPGADRSVVRSSQIQALEKSLGCTLPVRPAGDSVNSAGSQGLVDIEVSFGDSAERFGFRGGGVEKMLDMPGSNWPWGEEHIILGLDFLGLFVATFDGPRTWCSLDRPG
jgi:hypothetical protein